MSEAQVEAFAAGRKKIRMSNEHVYDVLREMGGKATAEQVIEHITKNGQMTAVEGKRVSQPVYRALSEGATDGVLDDSEKVINKDTNQPNTLYVLREVAGPTRPHEPTWKERALAAQETIKELKEKNGFLIDRNARLEDKNKELTFQLASYTTNQA